MASGSRLARPDRARAVARVRALGKDEAAALIKGRVLGPDDLPSVALGIDELEPATAEREILGLAHDAYVVEAFHRLVGRVHALRIFEIDREDEPLEEARPGRATELLFVVRRGVEPKYRAARLERDEALVADLRLRPAELPVEASHGRHVTDCERDKAQPRGHSRRGLPAIHGVTLQSVIDLSAEVRIWLFLPQKVLDIGALRWTLRIAHALAPVYERRPSRQNHDASTNAAMVPSMRSPKPSGSSRPAIT